MSLQKLLINSLPTCENYERSYMHVDTISHVLVTPTKDFLITIAIDGSLKFWKKTTGGIEFIKQFRAHRTAIQDVACSCDGSFLATISKDKSMKIFDVLNFDMINMFFFDHSPQSCEWIYTPGEAVPEIAVSREDSPVVYVYDGKGTKEPIHTLDLPHKAPVMKIRLNKVFSTVISVDKNSVIEYWSTSKYDFKFPDDRVSFRFKTDTHLFELAKNKTKIHDLQFTESGTHFATSSDDRKIRIFKFSSGKMLRVFDESLDFFANLQQEKQILPNIEYTRRRALEQELEKSEAFAFQRIAFDKSGTFVLYPTSLGVKIINWEKKKCVKTLGKSENFRPLCIALYQGIPDKPTHLDVRAGENPHADKLQMDPTLFCSAFKKNRFFFFTKRDPEASEEGSIVERDIYNEKPSREVMIASMDNPTAPRIYDSAIIHTTMGDIHVNLFGKLCPKTVENFCVHAKNGYYNGHIFHRVIHQFMIQTGDPTGTGTGGESIWGRDFQDEFHPSLKHDKPYTLSMANAGPNTNGSQFFITVVPCTWLDNKHTVFGRVFKGMETVQNISQARTNKSDKPFDDIKIISIKLK
ncbi:peptidylprolyl isomerase domain and WD repeat-containing protein 1 [Brevipalpus obovatus]|uniref:peptidylprolyl isomerase domain and WD repeat-containing protein 1 n=1 Tax=Brevipalpus obovatus TaxID=246614 RepID=UPI003D9EE8F2